MATTVTKARIKTANEKTITMDLNDKVKFYRGMCAQLLPLVSDEEAAATVQTVCDSFGLKLD